jgi:hemerythrin
MAVVAMETAKYKKIEKHKHDHSRLLAEQKLMKLEINNIYI